MSAASPEVIAVFWQRAPPATLDGAEPAIRAALWRFSEPKHFEVTGESDPATHIVSLAVDGQPRQSYFGDGRLRFTKQVSPWMLNVVRAGEMPRATFSGADRSTYLHVYPPDLLLRRAAEAASLMTEPAAIEIADPEARRDPGIERIGREMLTEMRMAGPLSRLRANLLGQDLAIQLLRRHSNLAGTPAAGRTARGGLAPRQVRRACDAMDSNIGGDIGLDMLASLVGVSPTHFSRAFRQSVGVAPFAWLLQRRIEHAKELLADRRLSLAAVALAVGFSAQPQFTTAFRRVTGTTPGVWRREQLL